MSEEEEQFNVALDGEVMCVTDRELNLFLARIPFTKDEAIELANRLNTAPHLSHLRIVATIHPVQPDTTESRQ